VVLILQLNNVVNLCGSVLIDEDLVAINGECGGSEVNVCHFSEFFRCCELHLSLLVNVQKGQQGQRLPVNQKFHDLAQVLF
jgi:hypothetical protein